MASSYITLAELYQRFGESFIRDLADFSRTQDADAITAALNAAIQDASEYVEDALRASQYATPLSGDFGSLKRIIGYLTFYNIYAQRGLRETDDQANRAVQLRDEAMRYLADVHAGLINLPLAKKRLGTRAPTVVNARTRQISEENVGGSLG